MKTRNVWTPRQLNRLIETIEIMMADYGFVDFATVADKCGHSMAACDWKARALDLKFTQKDPNRESYRPPKVFKGDMRNIPLHRDGHPVHYARAYV